MLFDTDRNHSVPVFFPSLLFPDRKYLPGLPVHSDTAAAGDALGALGVRAVTLIPDAREVENVPAALRRPAFRLAHSETFYSLYSLHTPYDISYYKTLLEKPVRSRYLLWPEDMIQAVPQSAPARLDLLFPYAPDAFYTPLPEVLDSFGMLTWQNGDILALGAKICYALYEINRSGYLYGELCPEKIFLDEENRVFFDFSDLIFPAENDALDNALCGYTASADVWPPAFTRSALFNGTQPAFDTAAQNYGLAALLFYLFFNIYPCDGRLLDGYNSDTKQNRQVKFRAYHAAPYFLFERNEAENPNRLGNFSGEQDLLRRWDAMPAALQENFQTVLCHENAVSTVPPARDVTPLDWLRTFDSLLDLRQLKIVL